MVAFSSCYCRLIYKNQVAKKVVELCDICKATGVSKEADTNTKDKTE